ncbi:MAG: type 2 isopentenyl-diphosphate Delta-isomerase [Bacteroidetes bacterium]|nr:type 2 isopentenyl-diphosphate Delta-isomerase [Bacteroidota bacterium]
MSELTNRKKAHVELTASGKASYDYSTGMESVQFRHEALPELNLSEISTEAVLLNRSFSMPLFISSMTGGYQGAIDVNEWIAAACERWNLPFGVGSQRAMLVDSAQTESFSIVRKTAPSAFIASNIGACQLIKDTELADIQRIIDCIEANALIIHLNPLQELMQTKGDTDFKGILKQIEFLCSSLTIPVIVKETGAGIHQRTAQKLVEVGVQVIDVAGAGGTSWAKVENLRKVESEQYSPFNNWGIPLKDCLDSFKGRNKNEYQLIASGGLKNALDCAKSIALGADFTATAQPIIKALVDGGEEALEVLLQKWHQELKLVLLLTGCGSVTELSRDKLMLV